MYTSSAWSFEFTSIQLHFVENRLFVKRMCPLSKRQTGGWALESCSRHQVGTTSRQYASIISYVSTSKRNCISISNGRMLWYVQNVIVQAWKMNGAKWCEEAAWKPHGQKELMSPQFKLPNRDAWATGQHALAQFHLTGNTETGTTDDAYQYQLLSPAPRTIL